MSNAVEATRLRGLMERYERLDVEIAELQEAQKEILQEVKGAGFDKKVFMDCVKARRQDTIAREEAKSIFELYMDAVK